MTQEIKTKIEAKAEEEYPDNILDSAIFQKGMEEVILHPAEYLEQLSDEDIRKAEIELSHAQKTVGTLYPFIEKIIKGYKAAQQPNNNQSTS